MQRFLEKKFFFFSFLKLQEEAEVCSVEWPVVTERERNQQGFIRVFIYRVAWYTEVSRVVSS